MTDAERWLRAFHDAQPGVTAAAFARGGSYDLVRARGRVLELACGDRDGGGIGVDLSRGELRARGGRAVVARAQALPFAAAAFDVVTCHLAFMLFDEIEAVVAELARVLAPGGRFLAVLGGGPTADGDDAFHRFLGVVAAHPRHAPRFGDPRARSEAGWRALFQRGWSAPTFERHVLELAGSFDEVWRFLGASYECAGHAAMRAATRAATADLVAADGRLPCRAVVWLAAVTRA